nr:MAG TPA: hypothetical protein [Caudoviricetes sp.]
MPRRCSNTNRSRTTLPKLMRIQEYFTIFSCITQAQEENIYEH